MKTLGLQETVSTNSWASQNWDTIEKPLLVYAYSQTGGRGQRGNTWESEPGKNLTATSVFVPPACVRPSGQFIISQLVSLAVCDLLEEFGVHAMVKWPNDIYVAEKKIAGILIECSILGSRIERCIAGIGLNVNQNRFVSDAPNPVSMAMIRHQEFDVDEMADRLGEKIDHRLKMLEGSSEQIIADMIMQEWKSRLWRGDGRIYPFFDRKTNRRINARIWQTGYDGMLTLMTDSGEEKTYAFKEVEFLM